MKLSVILVVVLYEILSIGVVSYLIRKHSKGNEQGGFALGGRSLGTWAIGTTMCLTLLGSGHLTGTWEGCLSLGTTQIWHVMANGFAMALGAVTIYCWARRMRITTTGEIATKLYGKELSILIAAVNIAVGWAVTSFETQALGIIISSMTGLPLNLMVLLSSVIGLCYIIFGGTKQAAMLNQINIIILYVGMFGALFFVLKMLPGFNFDSVASYYASNPDAYPNFLKFTGGAEHFLQVGIPILVAPFFAHCCGQQTIQTAASAKSEKALKRIVWFVGPMNVIIGAISICIAMTARTMPEFAQYDNKLVTTQMLITMLPDWFIAILFAAFVAALLSSYGGFLIGPATVITVDFIKEFYKKDMSEKQEAKLIRIFIGVGAVITCLMAQTLPTIVNMFTWIYSFMIPVFFLFVFGLWWKRNKKVGILAFVASWIVANIWTFFPSVPQALHMGNVHISYVIIAVSMVILVVGNLISKGKPGYFRSEEWRQSQAYRIYLDEKAKGNA
ncbi:MAG: sodium:solute symporter family protein [Butyricicoccus sp.]|nr:sodium:solute symporter family protein [Butyricicoccus sp.]